MAIKIPGNRPSRLSSLEPPAPFGLLMLGQLGFAAELDAARLGSLPAILRPLHDALALILRKRTQECAGYPWPLVAIINRSDRGLAARFAINAVCCVAILASRIGNGAAMPNGCSTKVRPALCVAS